LIVVLILNGLVWFINLVNFGLKTRAPCCIGGYFYSALLED